MKTLFLVFLSIAFISPISIAQELVTELNGFKLRQFREVPKNVLKTVVQKGTFEDGVEYEIYPADSDKSVYMVFQYSKSDLLSIDSIKLTGSKRDYDCKFKGLRFGMPAKEVEEILGKPSSIIDAGKYGERWIYEKTNYDLEIASEGILDSIRIIDNSPDLFPAASSKIPVFEQYSKILKSQDRKAISELLAPDLEIKKDNLIHIFKTSMSNEIEKDPSGIFKLINEVAGIAEDKNRQDETRDQGNNRKTIDPLYIVRFRYNGKTTEIIFKYTLGNYLIWKITLNKYYDPRYLDRPKKNYRTGNQERLLPSIPQVDLMLHY